MKRDESKYKIIIGILVLIILGLVAYIYYPSSVVANLGSVVIPDLSTKEYSKIGDIKTRISGSEGVIILTSGCYQLTAFSDSFVVESIEKGLEGKSEARPNAHEIAVDAFRLLDIDVLMVKITDIKENSFFAKLIIRQGNTILNLDARPSDAIAIAVRTNSSVYIKTDLLKEKGENIC